MILVITVNERNEKTHRMETLVSHGVDDRTGKTIIMPCERPEDIGAVWSPEYHSYIIPEPKPAAEPMAKLELEPQPLPEIDFGF